jgi:hypothetical protein
MKLRAGDFAAGIERGELPREFSELRSARRGDAAFTLMEVVIAMGIFFMAIFALLSLTSQGLRMARAVQNVALDPSILPAQLALTNRFEEGTVSGDFGDISPGSSWVRTTTLISSNGLYEVVWNINEKFGSSVRESSLTTWFYRPDSAVGTGILPLLRR